MLAGRSGAAGDVVLAELPRQLGLHLGGLLVMVAVVPFVASGVMIAVGLSRRAPERYRLYASIAWPALAGTLGLVTIVGTAIDLDGAEGVNERYVFYLVPLLLIGLAAWFEARPGRGRLALLILTAAVVVVALLPFDELAADATFYAPSLAPWVALALPGVLAAAARRVGAARAGRPLAPARRSRHARRGDRGRPRGWRSSRSWPPAPISSTPTRRCDVGGGRGRPGSTTQCRRASPSRCSGTSARRLRLRIPTTSP